MKLISNIITLSGNLFSDDIVGLYVPKSQIPACPVPSNFTHAIVGSDGACKGYVNLVNIP